MLARQIRMQQATPIIMQPACDSEIAMLLGLELGAEAYVLCPFSNRELVARELPNLRRLSSANAAGRAVHVPNRALVLGDLTIHPDA